MQILNKKCTILTTLLVSLSSLLQAYQVYYDLDTVYPYENFYKPLDFSGPICCRGAKEGSFFFEGDVLCWQSHVSGVELDFGSTYINETIANGVETFFGKELDIDPCFDWNAGFRLGTGYKCGGSSQLEFGLFWTYFRDTGRRNKHENTNTLNRSKFKLKFDQIDFVLAYHLSPRKNLTLKPFIGVRGTILHEEIKARLITEVLFASLPFGSTTRFLKDKENYQGVGPVFGCQGDWELGAGFGVYGTAAGSLLYGNNKTHFTDSDTFTVPIPREFFSKNRRHVHEFNWNVDLALGISWQTFVCDLCELTMKLGFEHHQYFNVSHLSATKGDVCFDGGIFSVNIAL